MSVQDVGGLRRLASALLLLACAPAAPTPASECRVERVVDGDTFYCLDGRKVRLIGIDAPELAQGEDGRRARETLRRLLPVGTRVQLELDAAPRDRYGRVLAYVWSGGRLVNEAMVREGWALLFTVPPNVRYVERFATAQRQARTRRAGAWAGQGFACAPVDYRRRNCR